MTERPPGFQWDDQKEKENMQRRGIPFNDAARVFHGPTIITLDDRFDYQYQGQPEQRCNALGFNANGRPLNVTYCERDEQIRIISARVASRRERQEMVEIFKAAEIDPPDQHQRERDRGADDDWMP